MSPQIKTEFEAISAIYDILQPLSDGARRRALAWLDDCFFGSEEQVFIVEDDDDFEDDVEFTNDDSSEYYDDEDEYDDEVDEQGEDVEEEEAEEVPEGYQTFDQFFDAIGPKTVRQKVATAAWWLEEEQGKESWKTFDISKSLKGIGQPVRYLSTTITQEKSKPEPLVKQLSKSGTSQQAHGTYQLTANGRAFVEERLGR